MTSYIDIAGDRYGKLVVLRRAPHEKSGTIEWLCRCDCGTEKIVPSGSLRQGRVRSCGCAATKGRRKDISGNKYGMLTVVKFVSMNANRTSNWLCRCDCGTEKVIRKTCLDIKGERKPEKTLSCGCHKKAVNAEAQHKHGEAGADGVRKKTKEYACWTNMIQRCYNPKNKRYASYGAKGVTVCGQWKNDFPQFLKDVGRAPVDRQYIDRTDPYGNYEPGNVQWVTFKESNKNKRGSACLTLVGVSDG